MATIHLIDLATDVKKYILKVQGDIKKNRCLGKFSQQKTIEKIVRDHKKFSKELPSK